MLDRNKIEEQLYSSFGVFEISNAAWSILQENDKFKEYAAEKTELGYRRCAFIAYGACLISENKQKSRAGYVKPTVRERYRRMTQFAADAFRVDIVESVRLTPEQLERMEREGDSINSCHNSFELRIGICKPEVIKRKPDWQRIMEQWNEAHPEDRIEKKDTFRIYYSRFINSLGYVPKGSLSFADINRIQKGRFLLRERSDFWKGMIRIIQDVETTTEEGMAYSRCFEDFCKETQLEIEEFDRLEEEMRICSLAPDAERINSVNKKLMSILKGETAEVV